MNDDFGKKCSAIEQCLPLSPFRASVENTHASMIDEIERLRAELIKLRSGDPGSPYAYVDDQNRLVKISGRTYFDGGFVDADRAIPASWSALHLVGGED